MKINFPAGTPQWGIDLIRQLEGWTRRVPTNPPRLPMFSVAELPSAQAWRGGMIIITDESDGEVPAWSDGNQWRRVTDRGVCF